MQVEVGDILMKRGLPPTLGIWGKWLFSYLIRKLTSDGAPIDESFSHCGIYAGNNKVWDARYPVVGKYSLDYGEYEVYRIALSDEQKQLLLQYCESKKGIPYATWDLLKYGVEDILHIDMPVDLTDDEWCSTFVVRAFDYIHKPITKKPFPTPNDIWWSIAGVQVQSVGKEGM